MFLLYHYYRVGGPPKVYSLWRRIRGMETAPFFGVYGPMQPKLGLEQTLHNKDHNILWSILEYPILGKLQRKILPPQWLNREP